MCKAQETVRQGYILSPLPFFSLLPLVLLLLLMSPISNRFAASAWRWEIEGSKNFYNSWNTAALLNPEKAE